MRAAVIGEFKIFAGSANPRADKPASFATCRRENLAIMMMMSITKARRGCELILDNPAIGCSVEAMIEIAVTDYFSAVAGR